jgi:ketosteroid isomerase-like protein
MTDRLHLTRDYYAAFAAADRDTVELLLAEDYRFSAPPDPALDRAGWFERCWPGAGTLRFERFVRLTEIGNDEVLVTYVAARPDGGCFQNVEIHRFDGEAVVATEVYFGWDLPVQT